MFAMVIANLLGIILLFFLLWKRLKDDYHYEKIFNLGLLVVFGSFLGLIISKMFTPEYWFWLELLGISIFFAVSIKSQKLKFFESLESLVIGLLPITGLHFLTLAIKNKSLGAFLISWSALISIFIFFFLNSRYRGFSWYKSGKVGFVGIATIIIFFLFRIALFLIYPQSPSFVNIDIYISSTFAFLFFLVLYSLSRIKE